MAEAPRSSPHEPAPSDPGGSPLPPAQPPAPVADREVEQAYSPLSVLAVGGFVLALAYAVVVIGGGLTAFLGKAPFLLPPWTLILPLGAMLAGWIARSQIQASEGALSGLALTRWAMILGLVFGLVYGAYYAATYTAITRQADTFARRWLTDIQQGKLQHAFLLTTPPPRPPEEAFTRDTLEVMHNTPGPRSQGAFTDFRRAEYVRLLAMAGSAASIEQAGVQHWSFDGGGYRVELLYRIHTPLARYRVAVTVMGVTSPSGEFKGRQWYVIRTSTGVPTETQGSEPEVVYTDQGNAYRALTYAVYQLLSTWVEDLAAQRLDSAFLYTVPQEMRDAFRKEGARWIGQGLAAGGIPADPQTRDYLRARSAFAQGSLIHAPESQLWTDPTRRAEILARARGLFARGLPFKDSLQIEYRVVPLLVEKEDSSQLAIDVLLELPQADPAQPPFHVQGQLIVEIRTSPGGGPQARTIQIVRLDLIRGATSAQGGDR